MQTAVLINLVVGLWTVLIKFNLHVLTNYWKKVFNLDFKSEITVDLSNNSITVVKELSELEIIYPTLILSRHKNVSVNLENNPFNSNWKVRDCARILKDHLNTNNNLYPIFTDTMRCYIPNSCVNMSLSSLREDKLTCKTGYEYLEPFNCTVYFRNKANVFDCKNVGLKDIPLELDSRSKTTDLNLSKNQLKSVDRLPKIYGHVTNLNLSHNNITEFNIPTIKNNQDLLRIKSLDLSYNNLTGFNISTIEILTSPNLTFLALHNNPWRCDCEAKPLVRFVKNHHKQLDPAHNVTCANGTVMVSVDESDLCRESRTDVMQQSLLFGVIVFTVIFVTTFLNYLYWRYKTAIQVYCYYSEWKPLQWLVPHPEYDANRTYDAFISYANEDETFVIEELVPFLEDGENKFKLCLHYRDWIPGDYIPDQIVRSVSSSQRTVVVLSPNFLKSVWGILEFKTAHIEALKDGTSRVIVILYQDVDSCQDIDDDLKAYIKLNTYLKWGSRWFWKQLNYALRRPPQKLIKRSGTHEDINMVVPFRKY